MQLFPGKYFLIFSFTAAVLSMQRLPAQIFSQSQEDRIMESARQILEQYEVYASFTEDGEKISQEYYSGFLTLFSDPRNTKVFNDADTDLSRGKAVTVFDYGMQVARNFPYGLDVYIDHETATMVSLAEVPRRIESFVVTIRVRKELYGLTSRRTIHDYNGELYFRFEFDIENGIPVNMTLTDISDELRYRRFLANQRLRGLHLGISGEPAGSMIMAPAIANNDYWVQDPGHEINYGMNLTWYFNRSVGFTLGAARTTYSSYLKMGLFNGQSDIELVDEDNDLYNPIFEISDLLEFNTLEYLEIPFSLNFRTGKASTGIYFDLGVIYAKSLNSGYRVEGIVNRMGYYEEYDITLEDVPEYGFTTVVLDEKGSWQVSPDSFLAISRLGLSIPLARAAYLRIGGVIVYGIDDIMYNQPKHPEDFISTTGITPDDTRLARAGLEIGFSYKLF